MNNNLTSNSKALVACFFEECERRFRFLEQEHDFAYFSGLVEQKNGRQIITPYQNQDVEAPFWITTRYELEDVALEISYGDEAYVVEGYLHHNHVNRYEWQDILWAAKKSYSGLAAQMGITSEINLQGTLEHMADSIKDNIDKFTAPSHKILHRAQSLRSKHLEENIREIYKNNLERASIAAAKAFLDKDYRQVIALLTPYGEDINRADQKKLKLAKRKLLDV